MNSINRWWRVPPAVALQFALGIIYAWSAFTLILKNADGLYALSYMEVSSIFIMALVVFGLVNIVSGHMQARLGMRFTALLGGVLLSAGYALAGFGGGTLFGLFEGQYLGFLLMIGVIAPVGIGLAYVIPMQVMTLWFPDKKSVMNGIAVAGFGFGAFVWIRAATLWGGGLNESFQIFGLPDIRSTFVMYAGALFVMTVGSSFFMRKPPDRYECTIPGYVPPRNNEHGGKEYAVSEMLRTATFYNLWFPMTLNVFAGLMVIGSIAFLGESLLPTVGLGVAESVAAGFMAGSWLAIANGVGRIMWGVIAQYTGRRRAIITMSLFQAVVLVSVYHIFVKQGQSHDHVVESFILAISLIGFGFGGNFALFVTATSDYFGNKSLSKNYGIVFTAYIPAGIFGPLSASWFIDTFKTVLPDGTEVIDPRLWMFPFILAAVLCLLAAWRAWLLPRLHQSVQKIVLKPQAESI